MRRPRCCHRRGGRCLSPTSTVACRWPQDRPATLRLPRRRIPGVAGACERAAARSGSVLRVPRAHRSRSGWRRGRFRRATTTPWATSTRPPRLPPATSSPFQPGRRQGERHGRAQFQLIDQRGTTKQLLRAWRTQLRSKDVRTGDLTPRPADGARHTAPFCSKGNISSLGQFADGVASEELTCR